jgi:hypothetical protein
VEERKEEYSSISGHKDERKARIASELFDRIHAIGGRFLKERKSETVVIQRVEERAW